MKHYSPTGRRNHGKHLKRLLDTWDRNGSRSGPTPWQIYDDDDDGSLNEKLAMVFSLVLSYLLYLLIYLLTYFIEHSPSW